MMNKKSHIFLVCFTDLFSWKMSKNAHKYVHLAIFSLDSHPGMALAKRFSSFDKKAFAFKVVFAERAIKALAVIIVVKSLNPTITSFNRKPTRYTFCREQFVPIFFAVGQSVFQIEWRVGEDFSTISANKTLRMKRFAHGLQTILRKHSQECDNHFSHNITLLLIC